MKGECAPTPFFISELEGAKGSPSITSPFTARRKILQYLSNRRFSGPRNGATVPEIEWWYLSRPVGSPVTVELVRNLMAHGDAREGKWSGNWRMECVASTLTPPPNVVYPALLKLKRTLRLPAVDLTDAPHRIKWTRPFRGKTKSGFCACAITFRTSYTSAKWHDLRLLNF